MKVNLAKNERLLTENERKAILDAYARIKKKDIIIGIVIFLVIYAMVSMLWGAVWFGMTKNGAIGLKQWLLCFLLMVVVTSAYGIKLFADLHMVVQKTKANSMYVKEAIYEMTTGKYNRVYLEMFKKGRLKYGGYNLLVREPLQKGDKVIVLQMRGRAWVYKARE